MRKLYTPVEHDPLTYLAVPECRVASRNVLEENITCSKDSKHTD